MQHTPRSRLQRTTLTSYVTSLPPPPLAAHLPREHQHASPRRPTRQPATAATLSGGGGHGIPRRHTQTFDVAHAATPRRLHGHGTRHDAPRARVHRLPRTSSAVSDTTVQPRTASLTNIHATPQAMNTDASTATANERYEMSDAWPASHIHCRRDTSGEHRARSSVKHTWDTPQSHHVCCQIAAPVTSQCMTQDLNSSSHSIHTHICVLTTGTATFGERRIMASQARGDNAAQTYTTSPDTCAYLCVAT